MDEFRNDDHDKKDFTAGVFLIDKPRGLTSFSIVRDVRRLLDMKKVGHAGTLDPFATGLLIICAGRPATRLIEGFMSGRKVYQAVLQLGQETTTLDPEGEVIQTAPVPGMTEEDIKICLEGFVGSQQQVPPMFSAVKHKGKPLYHYARKGVEIKKEPREIEVYSLDFMGYDPENHRLEIKVICSRGTYIRVLAADIGKKIGCGAHLVELRRLGSGRFSVADSLSGDALKRHDGKQKLLANMISVEQAVEQLAETEEKVIGPEKQPVEV